MTAAAGPDGIRPGDRAGRRYLGLWLPTFPLDRIERRLPAVERALARATVAEEKGALRLVAVNRAAAGLGLAPGLPLADARARHPALAVAPAAPAADAALLGRLADAGERYTPLIACDGPDGLMLDVTGCAHLFGGEKGLMRDLLARLRKAGFAARAALAATAGAAFGFARFGSAPAVVVPAGEGLGPLLAPLPVAALRLDALIVEGLVRLGLRRIGDLMDKPRAPLAARFGALVLRRLEEALGAAPSALAYRFPPPVFCAERRLMEPVERVEDVLGLAGHLAAALAVPLEQRDLGARRLDLVLFRVDGRMTRLPVGARRPLRDPDAIVRLFAEKVAALGVLDAGFGFDLIRLAVTETAPLAARQAGFGADDDAAAVDGLIDRLATRFGPMRVRRLVCADQHLPEAAGLSVAAQGWSPPAAVPDRGDRAPERLRAALEASGGGTLVCAQAGFGQVVRIHAGDAGTGEGEGIPAPAGSDRRSGVEQTLARGAETGWIVCSGDQPGLSLPASAGLGEAEEGGGPILPRDAGCGCRGGPFILEQAEGGMRQVAPTRASSGCHSEMLLPASPHPGDVEVGGEQVVPMSGDSGAARVEGSVERIIPLVPAVSSLRMPPAGRSGRLGSDGLPVSPEGTGRILSFPMTAVRPPDAAAPRSEASPVPAARLEPSATSLAERLVPVRSIGKADRHRDVAAAGLETPPTPERLRQPDERLELSVTSAAEGLVPVRSIGKADCHRDAAAAGPETPPALERPRQPDERLEPFAASAAEALVPVRSIGKADCHRDAAAAGPEAPPTPEQLGRLPADDRQEASAAGGPVPARDDREGADICGAARPLRLFTPPEPVEAVAEVPDGPPLRFRWRRRLHRVVRVEGPERIGGAWWTGDLRARDYFRVETEEGCRFWLFRTDPPGPEPAGPEVGDANGDGPRVPQSSTTDAPAPAFPRLDHGSGSMNRDHDPGDCPIASAAWEGVCASLGNALGPAPQGGRPGIWFLHGVLG